MSKIGRKPIDISNVQVDVKGSEVSYKGANSSGQYFLPELFEAKIAAKKLTLVPNAKMAESLKSRDLNCVWGMHRALLANAIVGSKNEFEKLIEINGLGYKVVQSGVNLVFTLGYSHKIDFKLPKKVSVSIDRSGQKLTVKSSDRELLGKVCDKICSLRRPEPYKGTGIKLSTEHIIRKAGKTK